MKIKRKVGLSIAAATLGVITLVSMGAVALAAEPNGVRAGGPNGAGVCPEAVTQLLGMTQEEIQAQRLEGKSLVQIADTKKVTAEQLTEAILAAKRDQIQERVTAGTLTQEQADLMLQTMQQNVVRAVNRTSVGQPEWAGGNGTGQKGLRAGGSGTCIGDPGANAGAGLGRQMRGANR